MDVDGSRIACIAREISAPDTYTDIFNSTGDDILFSPNTLATRGHMVTFLYRYSVK